MLVYSVALASCAVSVSLGISSIYCEFVDIVLQQAATRVRLEVGMEHGVGLTAPFRTYREGSLYKKHS
jgi:hypothetical protein